MEQTLKKIALILGLVCALILCGERAVREWHNDGAVGSTENLTLTDGGRAVLNDLLSSLNAPLRARLDEAASAIVSEMAANSGINASMDIIENGKFRVNLSYAGGEKPFSATLTVDDEATATKLCKQWKNSCTKASDELIRLILSGQNS